MSTEAATEPTKTADAGATPAEETALPDIDRATLLRLFEKNADDPELRKALQSNRLVAGIAGNLAQRQRDEERQKAAAEAVLKERQRLKDLSKSDPIAFAEEVGQRMDLEEKNREIANLRDLTRREFAKQVGDALQDLPGFKDFTADDLKELQDALAGVPEEKTIAAFTKTAALISSRKQAQTMTEAEVKRRLAEEKKAWEREQATKRVQGRPAPKVTKPSSGNVQDTGEPDFRADPKAWDAWYNAKRRDGSLVSYR